MDLLNYKTGKNLVSVSVFLKSNLNLSNSTFFYSILLYIEQFDQSVWKHLNCSIDTELLLKNKIMDMVTDLGLRL